MNKLCVYVVCISTFFSGYCVPMANATSELIEEEVPELTLQAQIQPGAMAVAAPQAQAQINPQQNILTRRKTCILVLCALATIAIPLGIMLQKPKESDSFWPFTCADDDTNMTNQCYAATIDNCGSCSETLYSRVRCPMQNITTAKNLIQTIKQEVEDTCGDKANYCVVQADCSDGYYVCDTDNLVGFIQKVRTTCQPKKKPKVRQNKSFFARKNMAWDKRRKQQRFK